jgi:hypothetical protein
MAEIVNLRRARKARQRSQAEAEAAANRVAFGRSKAERVVTEAEKTRAARALEGHRRDLPADDGSNA